MTNQTADAVAQWNTRYPIGTPVTAYPGLRPEDDPAADRLITRTRSEAQALGGHTAVVWVDGHDACIALSHVDPVQPADTYTPPAKYKRSDGVTCCPHTTPVAPGSCEACWDLVKWNAVDARLIPSSPAAVSAAVAPPTNHTALRDRIAAAIWERQNPGRRYADCEYRWQADAEADADAVLAVLPPTTDQAAVRAQAFDEAADMLAKLDPVKAALAGEHAWKDAAGLVRHMARQARRMADETATETPAVPTVPCSGTLGTPHQPHNWEPQPGMDPVHCPGTRKPPMDPVHILGIEADDEPAVAETTPPGGYTQRVCRHCWTGIHWTNGQWAHFDEPRGHTPEPPSLPVEPADGARQDGTET